MNINTLLIDETFVREHSTVSDNMDDALIRPSIIDAQLSGLMPLIGESLFDKLCEVKEEGVTNDNRLYNIFINNYVSMYLLYKTIANMTIDNFQKQHNAGSVNYVDTNYSNIYLNELKYMTQHWEDKASFYANRLVDYLIANKVNYPEFNNRVQGEMVPSIDSNTYHCGLSLGKNSNKNKV